MSYFLFTRDLRLDDNPALDFALKNAKSVIPIFILTKEQTGKENKYRSNRAIEFMLGCLAKLSTDLQKRGAKLHIFHGNLITVLKMLRKTDEIDTIYLTEDYSPFSKWRINELRKIFSTVVEIPGHLMIGKFYKDNGTPYEKFTPFYDRASKISVPLPKPLTRSGKFAKSHAESIAISGNFVMPSLIAPRNYDKIRNDINVETSRLSAHLKFGSVSVRRIYWKNKKNTAFTRQLWWREFYMNMFSETPDKWSRSIAWDNSHFVAWRDGKTGVPIIDASMICLRETGYLHNRLRMLVASFLVKTLHVDWRLGERYFATQLIDYDYFNNRGGWLWCAGLAADSQPYFRYFNPYKYDKDPFLSRWLPENHKYITIDLKAAVKKTISMYKKK